MISHSPLPWRAQPNVMTTVSEPCPVYRTVKPCYLIVTEPSNYCTSFVSRWDGLIRLLVALLVHVVYCTHRFYSYILYLVCGERLDTKNLRQTPDTVRYNTEETEYDIIPREGKSSTTYCANTEKSIYRTVSYGATDMLNTVYRHDTEEITSCTVWLRFVRGRTVLSLGTCPKTICFRRIFYPHPSSGVGFATKRKSISIRSFWLSKYLKFSLVSGKTAVRNINTSYCHTCQVSHPIIRHLRWCTSFFTVLLKRKRGTEVSGRFNSCNNSSKCTYVCSKVAVCYLEASTGLGL